MFGKAVLRQMKKLFRLYKLGLGEVLLRWFIEVHSVCLLLKYATIFVMKIRHTTSINPSKNKGLGMRSKNSNTLRCLTSLITKSHRCVPCHVVCITNFR